MATAVVPTGYPAWVRNSDITTYGGHSEKENHLGQGSIDALTDVNAQQFSRGTADLAAVARTAPFAVITFTCNDSVPAAPTINSVHGMIGVRNTSYAGDAAPTGFPSAARNSNGDVTFTFASSYNDEYNVAGAFTIAHPRGTLHGGAAGMVTCQKLTDTTVRVRGWIAAGTAQNNAVITLVINSGS